MYATDPFLCFSYNYTLLRQCKWGEQESLGIAKRHHILHMKEYPSSEVSQKHPRITHLRRQQAFYVCVIMMQKIAIIATCTGFRSKSDLC
jgi:hypothetical protein